MRDLMIYEVHDMDTANMVAAAESEDAILSTVVAYVAAHGRAAVEAWVLLRSTPDGLRKEAIAEGDTLADRALHTPAHGND
jgi:hypothetical protein